MNKELRQLYDTENQVIINNYQNSTNTFEEMKIN